MFVVLMLFGLMALAALVIDLGFARLTQRQMQTATDTAALEALRFRDEVPAYLYTDNNGQVDPELVALCGDPEPDNAEWCDCARRWAGSRLVDYTFDDDLNPDVDVRNFGAGPVIDFEEGVPLEGTEFLASETIVLPETPVYKPTMRLNLNDDTNGDMVASSPDSMTTQLRRTGESLDPDIGESGPRIPFLFGRGSLLNVDSRAAGIAVRSSSTARAYRAMSVGAAGVTRDMDGNVIDSWPGSLPFALYSSHWPPTFPLSFQDGSSVVSGGGVTVGIVTNATGESLPRTLGELLTAAALPSPHQFPAAVINSAGRDQDNRPFGYVPILTAGDRIVGFGWLSDINPGADDLSATVLVDKIAPMNVSATPAQIVDADVEITSLLLDEHGLLGSAIYSPALVK